MVLTPTVPVVPDAGEARRWIIDELSKSEYRAAQPTWFDRASQSFWDWLQSLRIGDGPAAQGPILLVGAVVVLGALITAFFIFGAPRLNRRSSVGGALFGEDDERDAAAMRRSAEQAASRGDWVAAIEEIFRSIARGLAERTILSVTPGTTAHAFAERAGALLPVFSERLGAAASAFDDVRYLDRDGTEQAYRDLITLERDLRSARVSVATPAALS